MPEYLYNYTHMYICIYIYIRYPHMDPGLVCLTCAFPVLYASFLLLGLVSKLAGCHIHIRYACMQTDVIKAMTSASGI